MKNFHIILLVFALMACKQSKAPTNNQDRRPSKLKTLFRPYNSNYPNISVHRGGKGLLYYPENCLETLQYVNDSIYAVYEVDVAQTKDGQLVLMHDNSIDRTTTGSGNVNKLTYNALKTYNLKDDYGNETQFKIPLFSEVLAWCQQNNVILTIDIKRSASQELVIEVIREVKAEDASIVITYDVEQAKSAYALAPELLFSVSARNQKELDRLLGSGIPTKNMLAFTGTRLSNESLYKRLYEANIVCMLGTLGNLDKQAEARGNQLYKIWIEKGIDILATDRPFEAFNAINN